MLGGFVNVSLATIYLFKSLFLEHSAAFDFYIKSDWVVVILMTTSLLRRHTYTSTSSQDFLGENQSLL